jgi:hypothetical protein
MQPPGTEPGGGAERVGFEPTEDLRPHFLSREAPSTGLGHLSRWGQTSVARGPSTNEVNVDVAYRFRGKPRSTVLVLGSGQREVTTLVRV